jgi:asparagine synthetase B (glutamine-hydrolysing)
MPCTPSLWQIPVHHNKPLPLTDDKVLRERGIALCDPVPRLRGYAVLSDELSRASHVPTDTIDERAVYSVLQYGAIIPPLAPWKQISRVVPGWEHEAHGSPQPRRLPHVQSEYRCHDSDDAKVAIVEGVIDRVVRNGIDGLKEPIVLFSGGVDSGFLASRLRGIGCTEAILVNCAFGEADPESALAEAMAAELGFRFERIVINRTSLAVLDSPGERFPLPFGDSSTPAAAAMAEEIVRRFEGERRVIIDGTGADGAFGLARKIESWRRIYRLPVVARRAASMWYRRGLWRSVGPWESIVRPIARSSGLSLPAAVTAQNGIVDDFVTVPEVGRQLQALLDRWIVIEDDFTMAQKAVVADLALTCANVFAQKCRAILTRAGHRVVFPFLDDEVVSLALAAIRTWRVGEPKSPLKQSLAKYVPREMVFRPKSAFADPQPRLFRTPAFIEMLCQSASDSAPLCDLVVKQRIREACDLLGKDKCVPSQTLNLLWAIVFTDRWYRTAPRPINSVK